jgi:peptidyl-prolyl cis-trans isomerase A (cyclophilin A)
MFAMIRCHSLFVHNVHQAQGPTAVRRAASALALLGAVAVLPGCGGGGDAPPPVSSIGVEGVVAYSKKLTLVVDGTGLETGNVSITTQGCLGLATLPGGSPERQRIACTVTGVAEVKVMAKAADGTELLARSFAVPQPRVELQTTLGPVVLALFPDKAPLTVFNFLNYVNSGFYNQTLFHRVAPNFVVQGGGYDSNLAVKPPTAAPIALESANGLLNLRGTLGMVRGATGQSATAEFYVNLQDNSGLNYVDVANPGYAVFARVSDGLPVFDTLQQVPTGTVGRLLNVPLTPVVLTQAVQLQ